jgi:hypothetical protein
MRQFSTIALSAGLVLFAAGAASGQSLAPPPALEAGQAIQLFEEAGFRLQEGRPVNRCGRPSSPRVAFVDLNGDGAAEAHVADVDPGCYGKPGAYFAILAQQADKRWKQLIAEDGIVGFEASRTAGWNDLSLEARDSACPGVRRFDGASYGAPTACASVAASAPRSPPPGARGGPVSQQHLFDWDGDQTPEARALPTAERDALFRAAGMEPVGGGKWSGCTDDTSGRSEAQVAMVQDLNGDGRPEAMIRDGGSYCNGMAGVSSIVLTQTAEGNWSILYRNQGFVNFLASRGADGYPDIEAGLPGFCFPYFRWDGTEYAMIARLNDEGRPCEPF